jgi:hypothetical protein
MSYYLLAGISLLLLILVFLASHSSTTKSIPVKARRLMSERERKVILLIEDMFPHCRVHAQVAMGALIEPAKGLEPGRRASVRNLFSQKIVDFVIEDRMSGDLLALVELDDRTHNAAKDSSRDGITKAAGYLTIRIPAGTRIDKESIESCMQLILIDRQAASD